MFSQPSREQHEPRARNGQKEMASKNKMLRIALRKYIRIRGFGAGRE